MQPKQDTHAEGAAALTALTTASLSLGRIEGVVVRDLRKHLDERGWLAELYRDDDEASKEFRPAMAYASATAPGVERGPHEHRDQADHFCFIGPSNFKLRLWDNRPGSPSYGSVTTIYAGEDAPRAVVVPRGVVHAYRNVGQSAGPSSTSPTASTPARGAAKRSTRYATRTTPRPSSGWTTDGSRQ